MKGTVAPGARVVIRDAEWRVKRIDKANDDSQILTCEGLSELVLGREAQFWDRLEEEIRVLAPEETTLVVDASEGKIPLRHAIEESSDAVEREFADQNERALLHVACTRAAQRLFITYRGTPSEYIRFGEESESP